LVNILQIYSWFPITNVCTSLAAFLSAEFFGYYCADVFLSANKYLGKPTEFFSFGVLFVLLAIIDWFYFALTPNVKNI
jgi:hypothetical protein